MRGYFSHETQSQHLPLLKQVSRPQHKLLAVLLRLGLAPHAAHPQQLRDGRRQLAHPPHPEVRGLRERAGALQVKGGELLLDGAALSHYMDAPVVADVGVHELGAHVEEAVLVKVASGLLGT